MKAMGNMFKMKSKIEIDLAITQLIATNDVFIYPWAERKGISFSLRKGIKLPHEYAFKLNDLGLICCVDVLKVIPSFFPFIFKMRKVV
jgi:hypothetical protein